MSSNEFKILKYMVGESMEKYSDDYLANLYNDIRELVDRNRIDSGSDIYKALIKMWDDYYSDHSSHLHFWMIDRLYDVIQKELAERFTRRYIKCDYFKGGISIEIN